DKGLNVTLMVMLEVGATVNGKLPAVKAKSPAFVPLTPIAVMIKFPVPEFDTVIGIAALVTFTACCPKSAAGGLMPICGPVPVPLRATVCGLPVALSTIERVAVLGPMFVGLKVMLIGEVAPGFTVNVVPDVIVNSEAFGPLIVTLL